MISQPYQILKAEDLLKSGEIESDELPLMFNKKTIMKFQTSDEANHFAAEFVKDYLIPTYGLEGAMKFPMARSEPMRKYKNLDDAALHLAELMEFTQKDSQSETWLVVPDDRFNEVEKYLKS